MAKQHFTTTYLKSLKAKDNPYRKWCSSVQGFGIQVSRAGSQSFIFQYTSPESGKRTAITLKTKELAAARKQATAFRDLVDVGVDPKLQLEREKQAKLSESQLSLGALLDYYCAWLDEREARSAEQVRGDLLRHVDQSYRSLKASDVTVEDIERLQADIYHERRKSVPARITSYIGSAYAFGMKPRPDSKVKRDMPRFGIRYNPAVGMAAGGKSKRGTTELSWDEIKLFWETAGTDALQMDAAIAIKLLLTTGQRVEEVLGAQWKEFDLGNKLWTIPSERRKSHWKSVTKEPHLVPLTELHIGLLKALKKLHKGKWLFPHKDGEKPRDAGSLGQALRRFCSPQGRSKREPFPTPFTPRDCRRTFKTRGGELKISKEIRDKIQGHAGADVSAQHYDRWDYLDEKRAALEKYCAHLDRLLTGETATVVSLRGVG
jgi:integrase